MNGEERCWRGVVTGCIDEVRWEGLRRESDATASRGRDRQLCRETVAPGRGMRVWEILAPGRGARWQGRAATLGCSSGWGRRSGGVTARNGDLGGLE